MSENDIDSRFPKQFGDFAESIVMYLLAKYKNMSVALVDHVGADIIATNKKNKEIYAISVKGRNFPNTESYSFNFDNHNVEKLEEFARNFNMIPAIAFVFCDDMEKDEKIRIFIITLENFKKIAKREDTKFITEAKSGYDIKYTQGSKVKHLEAIKNEKDIDYTEFVLKIYDKKLNI